MPTSPSLTLGGKVVLGAGALFLISSLLPWYSVSIKFLGQSQSDSANAWHFSLPKIAALLVIVLLAEVIVTQVATVKLPAAVPTGTWNLGRLGLSGLAALLILIELIKGQNSGLDDAKDAASLLSGLGGSGDLGLDVHIGRGIGMFLGVICVLALVAGNFLRLKETPAPVSSGGQSPAPWTPQPQPGQPTQPGAFDQAGQFNPADQPQYGTPNQPNQYGQPGEGQQPPYQS